MAQTLGKNEEGKLTDETVERLMLGVAGILKNTLEECGKLSPEEILDIHRNQHESDKLKEIVNSSYQKMLEADVPQVFNDYLGQFAQSILQQVFNQIAHKSNQNEQAVVEKIIGSPYNDISPKDVVDYIQANESEVK